MEPRVKRFPFFISYYDAVKHLDNAEEKAIFYDALMEYAFFGENPDFSGKLAAMFELAKPNIDKSVKNIKQGEINGAKGGAPPGNSNAKKKTTQGLNEIKMDKDKEKDKEDGKENDTVVNGREGTSSGSNINFEKIYAGS